MHARIEQLLSLRDGEPCEAPVAEHVAQCARCQSELDALRARRAALSELPALAPPDVWPAVAQRLQARRRRWRAPLALTAAVALAAGGLAWLAVTRDGPAPPPPVASEQAEAARAPVRAERDAVAARLAQLQARSARLEQRLAALDAQAPAVIRLGHEANAARLRAGLRALDAGHAQWAGAEREPDLERAYWHERVRLLDSLVAVERAERLQQAAGRVRVQPAAYRQ